MKSIYRTVHSGASKNAIELAGLLPTFPLLSFFGNLYYTDVLSTTLVLSCYLFAIKKSYKLSALVRPGLFRLILLGGTVGRGNPTDEYHLGGIYDGGVDNSGIEGGGYRSIGRGGKVGTSSRMDAL
jgi:DIE2/ALG10 family